MPVSYRWENNLFILDCEGTYTMDDLKSSFESGLPEESFPADVKFMLNVRDSDSLSERSPQDVRDMAKFLGERSHRFNDTCAIVAQESLHYGLMRMASVYTDTYGMRTSVFKTFDEAILWLSSNPVK